MLTTAELHREQHRWGIFFVLLPLLGVALLAFLLFFQTTAFATPQLVHVSLRSMLNANYQVDPHPTRMAALSFGVVADSIRAEQLNSSGARARLDALVNHMQTPVAAVGSTNTSIPVKAIVVTTPEAIATSAPLKPEPRDPTPLPGPLPSPAPPPVPPTTAPTALPPVGLQTAVPTSGPATAVPPTLPAATPPPTTAPQATPVTPEPGDTDTPLPRRTPKPTAEPKPTKETKPTKPSGTLTPLYSTTPVHENRRSSSDVFRVRWPDIPTLRVLAAWSSLLLR